jgi:hypothetical protein
VGESDPGLEGDVGEPAEVWALGSCSDTAGLWSGASAVGLASGAALQPPHGGAGHQAKDHQSHQRTAQRLGDHLVIGARVDAEVGAGGWPCGDAGVIGRRLSTLEPEGEGRRNVVSKGGLTGRNRLSRSGFRRGAVQPGRLRSRGPLLSGRRVKSTAGQSTGALIHYGHHARCRRFPPYRRRPS